MKHYLLSGILIILFSTFPLMAESDIYDRIGIIAEHGLHGAVPEENIDLFTGNLTLRFSGQPGGLRHWLERIFSRRQLFRARVFF